MMSFKLLEYNELNDITIEDITLDIFGEHSPNMGKNTILKLKQKHYDALMRANDIQTFTTNYKDLRIGYSKSESFYFYYFESRSRIKMFDSASGLVESFFGMWSYNDAGCSCEDCVQAVIVRYTSLSLKDAKQEMLEFLS